MCQCTTDKDYTQYFITSRVDWNGIKPFSIVAVYDSNYTELSLQQVEALFNQDIAVNVMQTKNWIAGSDFHKPVISSFPITLATYYLNIII